MTEWTSARVRQTFLDFFRQRGHTIVPSAPLPALDDPTLLFTNAGMNQFKDVFLGIGKRDYTRAADTQKCMRVSGKHNDLEEVGRDGRHHTFFEMLGNWSFGDYYKKEAIGWAWDLLVNVYGLPKDRLYATVLKDDVGNLGVDEETVRYWRSETDIAPEHILFCGRADNFWEMGDTGPCGPCSEINIDRGPEFCDRQDEPGHVCRVNGDCGRYMEFWNLVFIQYNRLPDQSLELLPARHVDTGLGLERLVSILQGVASDYDTDLFMPAILRMQELLGHSDAERQANQVAYRVIADHGRAITFLIGDGVMPGNEGAEYTLRMILRRAARFGRKLGFTRLFLADIAQVFIDLMGSHFRELVNRREFILATITQEEERFLRTIDRGLERMNEIVAAAQTGGSGVVSGRDVFVLWTQDGFPYDLVRDIAEEHGLSVDREGFDRAMEEHRVISGKGGIGEIDVGTLRAYRDLLEALQDSGCLSPGGVAHVYGAELERSTALVALLRLDGDTIRPACVDHATPGDRVEVILTETPFYVESGGQVSDQGMIVAENGTPGWRIRVEDVRRPLEGLIIHRGTVVDGQPTVGERAVAIVDRGRRMDIARNHTATHLLHRALRATLGEHVQQSGSLVASDRLRFDFSHGEPLTAEQRARVEELVNEAILADYPVQAAEESYTDAVAKGAMALFGEKYGDTVRVVRVGASDRPVSQELCGGTHVEHTGQIGLFRILSEGSVAAGVRRIEAVTGTAAVRLARARLDLLDDLAAHLSCRPDQVGERVASLLSEQQTLHKEIERLNRQIARERFKEILSRAKDIDGVTVLAAQVEAPSVETLREMCDWFRDRIDSGVVVLGAAIDGRPAIVAAVTPDLVARGVHAGRLIERVAHAVGGGGGGRPTMAHAGGRDLERLPEALALVSGLVKESLAH